MIYKVPKFDEKAFNCPNCKAYSAQIWEHYTYGDLKPPLTPTLKVHKKDEKKDLSIAQCSNCEEYSIWLNGKIINPSESSAPLAVENMPEDVLKLYNEASNVLNQSPRSACALLRLALQKLCVHLGGKKDNDINKNIGILVEKGLPERIKKSLDIIRVVGNNAVHAGAIDMDDNPEIANHLFKLINIIVESMITQSLEIDLLYDQLPDGPKKAIKRRDSR